MSKSTFDFGDQPFDYEGQQFVFSEAVEICGIPAKTLNNWTQRTVVEVGEMHRTGRRLYSFLDLVQLATVAEASSLVPPAVASHAGVEARMDVLAGHTAEIMEKLSTGKAPTQPFHQKFLLLWKEDGEHRMKIEQGTSWCAKAHSRAFAVVPLTAIRQRVFAKAVEVLEREWNKRQQKGDDE
jgi:hypothetical protein